MTSQAEAGRSPSEVRGNPPTPPGAAAPAAHTAEPLGGDPACWLNRVCDACGRFIDDEAALTCPLCGAARA